MKINYSQHKISTGKTAPVRHLPKKITPGGKGVINLVV